MTRSEFENFNELKELLSRIKKTVSQENIEKVKQENNNYDAVYPLIIGDIKGEIEYFEKLFK